MEEKRTGVNPIPAIPHHYINEQQIHALSILRKFAWGLVCVRRRSELYPITILKNCQDKTYGILTGEGILKLSKDLKVRDPNKLKCGTDINIEFLNDFQMQALRRLESMGYKLRFARKPLFQDVIAVASHTQDHKIGMLKENGAIDFYPDIHLNNWDSEHIIQKLELVADANSRILALSTPQRSLA